MRLTTSELQDMMSCAIIRYMANETDVNIDVERLSHIVKWVESQDFEFRLEAMRED